MPTVVAKGSTALALDARYATPEGRWASLKALRAAYSAGQDGVNAAATVGSLAKNERDHLRGHWFTAATDHWMMLKPAWNATPWFPSSVFITYEPTQPDLTHGARVLTAGLIQALEASLGLKGPDDSPPLQLGSNGAPISVNGLDQVRECGVIPAGAVTAGGNQPAKPHTFQNDIQWKCVAIFLQNVVHFLHRRAAFNDHAWMRIV